MQTQINKLNFNGVDIHIGIDVHKKNWTISTRIGEKAFHSFSQNPDVEQLHSYLKKNFPGATYHLAYEAGFCGFWICNYFKEHGIDCIVVNPADIPTKDNERRKKEDKRDSRKIARALSKNELDAIYVPSVKALEDRFLLRTRQRLVWDLTRNKNRIKSALYFQGIHYPPQFQKNSTHWSNSFTCWLEQIKQTQESGKKAFDVLLTEVKSLRASLLSINRAIREMSRSEAYRRSVKLLIIIPGIGLITAMTLLTELADIHRFNNIDQLCSYIGFVPNMNNSSDTIKETNITSRSNKTLRTLLIESAWSAIRCDPALALKYHQLSHRMTSNRAIVRIAKKLVKRILYVLKNQKEYELAIA
jgi:transposase